MPLNGQFQPLGPVIFLQAPSSLLKGVSMSHLRCFETQLMREKYHQNPSSKEIFS